jgi:hypothetical protein
MLNYQRVLKIHPFDMGFVNMVNTPSLWPSKNGARGNLKASSGKKNAYPQRKSMVSLEKKWCMP